MGDVPGQFYERLLVIRSQAGDALAFEELVATYSQRLRYFLRRLVLDATTAEDLLQDVWLDVYRGLRKLREPDAFRAWLYRIARDRAFQFVRRKRTVCQLPDDVEGTLHDSPEPEFNAEDAQRIHVALHCLSPEHREVLVLRFIEGMPYEEIARVTEINMGTVRSRIHYAKRALRHIIIEKDG